MGVSELDRLVMILMASISTQPYVSEKSIKDIVRLHLETDKDVYNLSGM